MHVQIRPACEVPEAVGHEKRFTGDSRCRNQESKARNQLPLAAEAVPDRPESPQGCRGKLNNGERLKERITGRQFRFSIRRSGGIEAFPVRADAFSKSCSPQPRHFEGDTWSAAAQRGSEVATGSNEVAWARWSLVAGSGGSAQIWQLRLTGSTASLNCTCCGRIQWRGVRNGLADSCWPRLAIGIMEMTTGVRLVVSRGEEGPAVLWPAQQAAAIASCISCTKRKVSGYARVAAAGLFGSASRQRRACSSSGA